MIKKRTLDATALVQFSPATDSKGKVVEVAITESQSVAVWGVRPGQSVPAHLHPDGQDTWIMVKGELKYLMGNGERSAIRAGTIAVAEHHQIHGAINDGFEDAIFISIYSAPSLKVEPAAE